MQQTFRTLIIDAQDVELIRHIAATLDSTATGMFTTALTSDDTHITHYISSGYLNDVWGEIVPCKFWGMNDDGAWVVTHETAGNLDAIQYQCAQYNIDITTDMLQAMWNRADVTDQEPFTAMARLNLRLYSEPIHE